MPAVTARYQAPGEREADAAGDKERRARAEMMAQAWAYFEGDHKKPLRVNPSQGDDNIILNLCGQAMDKLTAFIGVPRLESAADDAAADAVIDRFWEANNLPELVGDVLLSGLLCGHTFLRLYHDGTGWDVRDNVPSVGLIDPRYVTVYWDATNPRRALWYRLTWRDAETVRQQDIVPNWLLAGASVDPLSAWTIIEYGQTRGGGWQEIGRDAWEYPFAPIVDWKNAQQPHVFYGRGDLRTQLNDAVNFVASNVAKIIRHHAGPQTVAVNAHLPDELLVGPGAIIEIQGDGAQLYNLEMKSDLESSMAMLSLLRGSFFSEHRVIDISTIRDKLGQVTNFGLRMMYGDMIDVATQRRRIYGNGLAEVTRRALVMMGVDAKVRAVWDELLPQNRMELVETLEKEQALGVVDTADIVAELAHLDAQ